MTAADLLSNDIMPLSVNDSCRNALDSMNDLRISCIPVVDDRKLITLLSDNDIYRYDDLDGKIGDMKLNVAPFVYDNQHVFDVLKMFKMYHLPLLPVIDRFDNYLGVITFSGLIDYMADVLSVSEPGALIMIEMGVNDYSLGEIARLIEENNAKILSLMLCNKTESSRITICIKINLIDASAVIQTLRRFDYNVSGSFDNVGNDDLRERFESFMKFLDI